MERSRACRRVLFRGDMDRAAASATRCRGDLSHRLYRCAAAVQAAAGRTRPVAGSVLSGAGSFSRCAEPLLVEVFGSGAGCGGVGGRRRIGVRGVWADRGRAGVAFCGGVVAVVCALSLDSKCGADVLRLRLGIDAAGGGVLHGFSRAGPCEAFVPADPDSALDALPYGTRRGPDQAAARPLLARPDMPLFPLRNAAPAQSAELVFSPAAEGAAALLGAGESFCAGDCSVWAVRAATGCVRRGRADCVSSTLADRDRELLLAELADRGAGRGGIQRCDPA